MTRRQKKLRSSLGEKDHKLSKVEQKLSRDIYYCFCSDVHRDLYRKPSRFTVDPRKHWNG